MDSPVDWDELMISMGLEPSSPRGRKQPKQAEGPKLPARGKRRVAKCGTPSGCSRHYQLGEKPCPACRAAQSAAVAAWRARRRGGPPNPVLPAPREHGTPRGARQHWKYREPVCPECRTAYNTWQNTRRAAQQAAA